MHVSAVDTTARAGSSVGTFINTGSGGAGQEDALLLSHEIAPENSVISKKF